MGSPSLVVWVASVSLALASEVHHAADRSILWDHGHLNPRQPGPHGLWTWKEMSARIMSQLSKVKQRRNQWKDKAQQRGERERYQRKQIARITAERNRTTKALNVAQARLRQLEAQLQGQAALPKVDVVLVTLQLFWLSGNFRSS
jgi:hypothetical protein